eukprot:4103605-Pleurochrysis_carterae.AAC.3
MRPSAWRASCEVGLEKRSSRLKQRMNGKSGWASSASARMHMMAAPSILATSTQFKGDRDRAITDVSVAATDAA